MSKVIEVLGKLMVSLMLMAFGLIPGGVVGIINVAMAWRAGGLWLIALIAIVFIVFGALIIWEVHKEYKKLGRDTFFTETHTYSYWQRIGQVLIGPNIVSCGIVTLVLPLILMLWHG